MTDPTPDPKPRPRHPLYDKPAEPQTERPQPPQQPIRVTVPPTMGQRPYLTYALIAINVLIFLVRYISEPTALAWLLQGAIIPEAILQQGEWYRLFTSMFLHLDEAHILFNSLALFYIGQFVETNSGWARFAIIYILGGLGGSALHLLLGGYETLAAGASGAVFALWGAQVLYLRLHRDILGPRAQVLLRNSVLLMGLNFFLGFFTSGLDAVTGGQVQAVIANWAHLGGLVGGVVLAWLLGPRHSVKRGQTSDGQHHIVIADEHPLATHYGSISLYLIGLVAVLLLSVLFVGP